MAAVPPVSEKVCVVAAGAADVGTGVVEVDVDVDVEVDWVVAVGAGCVAGDVVDGDEVWSAGALFDEAVLDDAASEGAVFEEVPVACVDDVDELASADPSGSVVVVAPGDTTSVAEGGATT